LTIKNEVSPKEIQRKTNQHQLRLVNQQQKLATSFSWAPSH